MSKRLVVPIKTTVTVAAGAGSFNLGPFAGALTYIVVEGPVNARGKLRLRDLDEGQDIFKDPKPTNPDPRLEFYTNEIRVPVNGAYRFFIESATADGAYVVYLIFEERPTRV